MSHQKNAINAGWRSYAARLIAGALGVLLLSAALMKMTDINLFVRQIKDYGIITDHFFLAITARGLIAVECALGAALLSFYRPRITLLLTSALLAVFAGASSWAWITGATGDCGCFGAWVKRTPKEAAIEGLLMLALALTAWVMKGGSRRPRVSHGAVPVVVGAALVAGLALPVAMGSHLTAPAPGREKTGDGFARALHIEGLEGIDLASGDYLVVLMDTDCSHCREAVAELNWLAETPDLPEVIGLSANGQDQINAFRDELRAVFPIGRISEEEFWRLLGDGNIPRTFLVSDDLVRKMWDVEIPDEEALRSFSSL